MCLGSCFKIASSYVPLQVQIINQSVMEYLKEIIKKWKKNYSLFQNSIRFLVILQFCISRTKNLPNFSFLTIVYNSTYKNSIFYICFIIIINSGLELASPLKYIYNYQNIFFLSLKVSCNTERRVKRDQANGWTRTCLFTRVLKD